MRALLSQSSQLPKVALSFTIILGTRFQYMNGERVVDTSVYYNQTELILILNFKKIYQANSFSSTNTYF